MTDRFDLEQEIMKCWSITEDIQNFLAEDELTTDQQQNYLLGLATIYEVKFNKLWTAFENCVKRGEV
jgi:hypothetical protein